MSDTPFNVPGTIKALPGRPPFKSFQDAVTRVGDRLSKMPQDHILYIIKCQLRGTEGDQPGTNVRWGFIRREFQQCIVDEIQEACEDPEQFCAALYFALYGTNRPWDITTITRYIIARIASEAISRTSMGLWYIQLQDYHNKVEGVGVSPGAQPMDDLPDTPSELSSVPKPRDYIPVEPPTPVTKEPPHEDSDGSTKGLESTPGPEREPPPELTPTPVPLSPQGALRPNRRRQAGTPTSDQATHPVTETTEAVPGDPDGQGVDPPVHQDSAPADIAG